MLSAIESLNSENFNNHFIRSINKVLLTNNKGKDKNPGKFREIEVHIGPSRYT